MKESTDWQLLARYLSGECSQEEQESVHQWLAKNKENQQTLELLKISWNVPDPQQQTSDVKSLWNQVAAKANITPKAVEVEDQDSLKQKAKIIKWPLNFQTTTFRILRYAAILIFATSLVYIFSKIGGEFPWQTDEFETLVVENGQRQHITLGDGTAISLDAGSSLSYPKEFDGETREVFLNGEGYFEVVSNPDKPFIVHANHAEVKVLGTKFNVRAWQVDRRVSVSVAEGRVSLKPGHSDTHGQVIIVKGQSSTLTENGLPTQPQLVDINRILGWMNNEFFFDDAPLREILFQLERWFDVQFFLADSSVELEQLTLHVQDKSLEEILQLISALTDLRYNQTEKQVHLTQGSNNDI